MGVIDPSLTEFKSKVSSSLGSMTTASSTLASNLQTLSSSASTVQSCIDSSYNSTNKSTILSNLGRVNDVYSKIAASLDSDLNSFISSAQDVVDKVDYLEELNKIIDDLNNTISANSGDESEAVAARISAQESLQSKNTEFDEKHAEAKTALAALKAQDGSVSFCQEFSTTDYENVKDSLEYGTFELKEFTSSTGETIEYYIYVPDYGTDVENLPCMLYLHGSTSGYYTDTGWSNYGLTGLIKDQSVTPSGIVILFNEVQPKKLPPVILTRF